jgi:hypothetical protein
VSGGVRVFVDQAAQDRLSADVPRFDVGHGGAGSVKFVRDALGNALVQCCPENVGGSVLPPAGLAG